MTTNHLVTLLLVMSFLWYVCNRDEPVAEEREDFVVASIMGAKLAATHLTYHGSIHGLFD